MEMWLTRDDWTSSATVGRSYDQVVTRHFDGPLDDELHRNSGSFLVESESCRIDLTERQCRKHN